MASSGPNDPPSGLDRTEDSKEENKEENKEESHDPNLSFFADCDATTFQTTAENLSDDEEILQAVTDPQMLRFRAEAPEFFQEIYPPTVRLWDVCKDRPDRIREVRSNIRQLVNMWEHEAAGHYLSAVAALDQGAQHDFLELHSQHSSAGGQAPHPQSAVAAIRNYHAAQGGSTSEEDTKPAAKPVFATSSLAMAHPPSSSSSATSSAEKKPQATPPSASVPTMKEVLASKFKSSVGSADKISSPRTSDGTHDEAFEQQRGFKRMKDDSPESLGSKEQGDNKRAKMAHG